MHRRPLRGFPGGHRGGPHGLGFGLGPRLIGHQEAPHEPREHPSQDLDRNGTPSSALGGPGGHGTVVGRRRGFARTGERGMRRSLHRLSRGVERRGSWYNLGSRLSALGSRLSALGSRLSALGSRLSALGSRLSALGSLLIASSEFAPDAPSCEARTAAGDCAAAGARPSTSCRSMRIDIRPYVVSA